MGIIKHQNGRHTHWGAHSDVGFNFMIVIVLRCWWKNNNAGHLFRYVGNCFNVMNRFNVFLSTHLVYNTHPQYRCKRLKLLVHGLKLPRLEAIESLGNNVTNVNLTDYARWHWQVNRWQYTRLESFEVTEVHHNLSFETYHMRSYFRF